MASHNHTGRSKKPGGRFVSLPFAVIDSPGFRATRPNARAVLIEALRIYNGKNNGSLALSARAIADRLGVSKDTAARAIRELINCGLLRKTKSSSFSQKRLAAEYRLTHLGCDLSHTPATREYLSHGKAASCVSNLPALGRCV